MGARGLVHEAQRGESVEWYKPPRISDALGETFDLDPCSPGAGKSFVPADAHFTIEDDGLTQMWGNHRFVWMNPPYGAQTAKWMRKLAEHGNGIALVFARTDVAWFHEIAPHASAICLVKGRIHFYQGPTDNPGGTPGAGSVLPAFGDRAHHAVAKSGLGLTFIPDR